MQPILVIEDDPQFRQTVHAALSDEGWAVAVAADGRQALDWLRRQRPSLVLLDWTLPEFDGAAVAATLRATHGVSVPVLLMTADGSAGDKARRVGAFAYLHKPFELDDLIELVQRGLERPSA
jgi:DNA-binding response OmpR family regulator